MPYYEVLKWSSFHHPSFIAWVILLIWGLGAFVWKKNKKLISSVEFFLYGVLLLCFAFIVQARVVIVAFPLTILLLIWFSIANKWRYHKRIFIEMGILLMGLLSIFFLVKKTTYFSDPISFDARGCDTLGCIATQSPVGFLVELAYYLK